MADIFIQQPMLPDNLFYNNTMASTGNEIKNSFENWDRNPIRPKLQNNIYRYSLKPNNPGSNDITSGTDPLFVDPSAGGLGFRLQPGSPAIDKGIVIEGITGDYQGSAPDAGAYEFGGVEWKAGNTSMPGPLVSEKELKR